MCSQFDNVILKRDIGSFKKGNKVVWAYLNYKNSTLELGESSDNCEKFDLLLSVKEKN